MAPGKKNERAICPKDEQVFSSPGICKLRICPFCLFVFFLLILFLFFIASKTHPEKKQKLHRINKVIKKSVSSKIVTAH